MKAISHGAQSWATASRTCRIWNWRWYNTFGDGQLLDWGGHHVNTAPLDAWTRRLRPHLDRWHGGFRHQAAQHYQNFIDCVCARKLPVVHPEAAYRAASFGQVAIESQYLNVAALYFAKDADRGGFSGFNASDEVDNEFLQSTVLKTLIGYPVRVS